MEGEIGDEDICLRAERAAQWREFDHRKMSTKTPHFISPLMIQIIFIVVFNISVVSVPSLASQATHTSSGTARRVLAPLPRRHHGAGADIELQCRRMEEGQSDSGQNRAGMSSSSSNAVFPQGSPLPEHHQLGQVYGTTSDRRSLPPLTPMRRVANSQHMNAGRREVVVHGPGYIPVSRQCSAANVSQSRGVIIESVPPDAVSSGSSPKLSVEIESLAAEVVSCLVCPITRCIYKDPWLCSDDFIYEKSIVRFLQRSPFTRERLEPRRSRHHRSLAHFQGWVLKKWRLESSFPDWIQTKLQELDRADTPGHAPDRRWREILTLMQKLNDLEPNPKILRRLISEKVRKEHRIQNMSYSSVPPSNDVMRCPEIDERLDILLRPVDGAELMARYSSNDSDANVASEACCMLLMCMFVLFFVSGTVIMSQ